MGINEAGNNDAILQIDYGRVGRDFCFVEWTDVGNSVILDDHAIDELISLCCRRRKDTAVLEDGGHGVRLGCVWGSAEKA